MIAGLALLLLAFLTILGTVVLLVRVERSDGLPTGLGARLWTNLIAWWLAPSARWREGGWARCWR